MQVFRWLVSGLVVAAGVYLIVNRQDYLGGVTVVGIGVGLWYAFRP